MKIKIETSTGSTEINITAKSSFSDRANKIDLMYFLNELAIVYKDASDFNAGLGLDALAKDYREKGDLLHKICEEMGAYKGL